MKTIMICGDTIFKINGTHKSPVMIVDGGGSFGVTSNDHEGYITSLLLKSTGSYFFSNQLLELKNRALNMRDVHYYEVEGNNYNLSEITEFTLENLGKTYSYEELKKGTLTTSLYFDLAREHLVLKIESIDFKTIIEDNKMNARGDQLDQIKQLGKEITIYDNPVLLIGKLRKVSDR